MTSIPITPETISFATARAEEMGALKNSITGGAGNIAGTVGEIVALKTMGLKLKHLVSDSNYECDIIDGDGVKWDVKTKRRTVKPSPHFNCSVADFNTHQKCDRYIFVSLYNLERGYVLGWISKEDFYKKATFNKKGEYDRNTALGQKFKFTADCYNLKVKHLKKL